MERRQLGVLLLAAAVLTVVVFAGLNARRVVGSPRASQVVPRPPAVGDCVPDPVNPDSWNTGYYGYPRLRFEACDGFRFGEVVAVLANPGEPPATTASDASAPAGDPNAITCLEAGTTYVGADPQLQWWSARVYAFAEPISPSPLQQAVGQHWLACAMFIPANDAQTAVAHYHGSLRNAMLTGNQRELLGFCGVGHDWTTGGIPMCSSPHDFQQLAIAIVGHADVSNDELQRTCVQYAQRLTALRDVTASGALAVEVRTIDKDAASSGSAGGLGKSKLACGISTVGSRRLAGSLVALGDLPIPWA